MPDSFDAWILDDGERVGMISVTAMGDRDARALLDGDMDVEER